MFSENLFFSHLIILVETEQLWDDGMTSNTHVALVMLCALYYSFHHLHKNHFSIYFSPFGSQL